MPRGVYERSKYCKRGHERTPENVNSSNGCKICTRLNEIARKRAKGVKPKKREHFCDHGHPLTVGNLTPNGKCKVCRKERKVKAEKKNPQMVLAMYRRKHAKSRKRLTNYYIANHLFLSKVQDIPVVLIEIKRLQISINRKVKEMDNENC